MPTTCARCMHSPRPCCRTSSRDRRAAVGLLALSGHGDVAAHSLVIPGPSPGPSPGMTMSGGAAYVLSRTDREPSQALGVVRLANAVIWRDDEQDKREGRPMFAPPAVIETEIFAELPAR